MIRCKTWVEFVKGDDGYGMPIYVRKELADKYLHEWRAAKDTFNEFELPALGLRADDQIRMRDGTMEVHSDTMKKLDENGLITEKENTEFKYR